MRTVLFLFCCMVALAAFSPLVGAQETPGEEVRKEHYDTGELWEEGFFEGGQRTKSIEYYKNGNLRSIVYYGGMVGREQVFSGGDATLVHHYHPNGKLWKLLHFKDGELEKYLEYGPDGEVVAKEPPAPEKISQAHLEGSSPGTIKYESECELQGLSHRVLGSKYDIFEVRGDSAELIMSIPWTASPPDQTSGFRLEVRGRHLRIVYDFEMLRRMSYIDRLLFKAKISNLKPGAYVLDVVCPMNACYYSPSKSSPWEDREKAFLLGIKREHGFSSTGEYIKIFNRNFTIE